MDGADHVFAIILLISGTVGVFRGFIRESISIASWLIGLWLAWRFAYIVNPWLGGALSEPGVREWTGRAIVLLLVLLFGSLVGSVVSHYARRAIGLAAMDRTLGGAFGLVRGILIIGLLVLAAAPSTSTSSPGGNAPVRCGPPKRSRTGSSATRSPRPSTSMTRRRRRRGSRPCADWSGWSGLRRSTSASTTRSPCCSTAARTPPAS